MLVISLQRDLTEVQCNALVPSGIRSSLESMLTSDATRYLSTVAPFTNMV